MRSDYRDWLERQKYDGGTISAQLHRVGRVEKFYGNIDEHYSKDRLESVIAALKYTSDDKRRGKPNPSKIPFEGDAYNNLASYRNSTVLYQRFRDGGTYDELSASADVRAPEALDDELPIVQRFGLERDMQAALRKSIGRLEEGLTIVDDGVERIVDSGRIDITARDASGALVIIELKAGVAGHGAIGQILSYMGDVTTEEPSEKVRGILVASDFDKKARSAAKMTPSLALRCYSIEFRFSEISIPVV